MGTNVKRVENEIMLKKGTIGFSGHRVNCIIGMHPEERICPQDILIDLKVSYDFAACLASDHVKDTVCYESLAHICSSIAIEAKAHLIESLAEKIATNLKARFEFKDVWVRIKKPGGLKSARYTYVEYEV